MFKIYLQDEKIMNTMFEVSLLTGCRLWIDLTWHGMIRHGYGTRLTMQKT